MKRERLKSAIVLLLLAQADLLVSIVNISANTKLGRLFSVKASAALPYNVYLMISNRGFPNP